jgi:Holliday junction resolvase RusA-like endonuclease
MATRYAPTVPSCKPVCLKLDVYRPIPKGFNKKKVVDAENGLLRPVTKPDGSNYLKLVEDALNGLMWADDSQIVDTHVSKWYSKYPRIEVLIFEIGEVVACGL